jgi:hypothetical protein
MALGDAIFESLLSMDRYASQRPRHTEEDLRFHDLYRQVTIAMRILLMYEDQIQEVNYAAFVSRAKQMIQENDPRPWETLQEELKVELLRPVVIPSYEQDRRIDVGPSDAGGPSVALAAELASRSTRIDSARAEGMDNDECRLIHIPTQERTDSDGTRVG